MRRHTLRGRIVVSSTLTLALMAAATLYTGFTSYELAQGVNVLFRKTQAMESLEGTLNQTEAKFTEYLRTKSSDSLKDYIKESTTLTSQARTLNLVIWPDELLLLERDLSRSFATYLNVADAAIDAKRARDIPGYVQRFDLARQEASFARDLILELKGRFLAQSLDTFSTYRALIPSVLLTDGALVLLAAALSLVVVFRYSRRLTQPLTHLAEAADALGRGDFDAVIPTVPSGDELGTMAQAFAVMRQNVKDSFADIQSRAEVERNLFQQRMQVLELGHRLKDAELLALQTQINPHFLFNTMSAGLQLANVEEAPRTASFLENLSVFIRYTLNPPDRLVVIADELDCVNRYIWLLRLRFGERYRFEVRVNPEIGRVEVPALILQPLVENAIGHGLADRESGGVVVIKGEASDEGSVLTVSDNGAGMNLEERQNVLAESLGDERSVGHGIGLRNVIRRIHLSTNGLGKVELLSGIEGGLSVRVVLPAFSVIEEV